MEPSLDDHEDRSCLDDGNVVGIGLGLGTGKDNKELRFAMYKAYSRLLHGVPGKGNRLSLPKCIEEGIHDTFPDTNGVYREFDNCS